MLRSLKTLRGYTIRGTDGDIGHVHEFYVDDQAWTVRYLVVETGSWLESRKVLLTPVALEQPVWDEKVFPVLLTRRQVEQAPPIATDKPVSRQMEADLHRYYGWSPYWRIGTVPLATGAQVAAQAIAATAREMEHEAENTAAADGSMHLRSSREVEGYHIHAVDGDIGHVDDFIADDEAWCIRYLVVDTQNWLPGKRVLIAPAWITRVSWADWKVHVDLHKQQIADAPAFNPREPVNREYEVRLYDFYGRPQYWTRL
jgi:hypothetical protein